MEHQEDGINSRARKTLTFVEHFQSPAKVSIPSNQPMSTPERAPGSQQTDLQLVDVSNRRERKNNS